MTDLQLFSQWGLDFSRRREELAIEGSPNRSAERFTAEVRSGELWIAEGFPLEKLRKQQHQTELLEFLARAGLPVLPWKRTREGDPGVRDRLRYWQLRPFVSADPLPRRTLGEERAYAEAWQEFLLQLARVSRDPRLPLPVRDRFDFAGYLPMLKHHVENRMPGLLAPLECLLTRLSGFFAAESKLPAMLAHGDFHPGNVLMHGGRISAVIDWEFCSWKCAGYDLALLTGCLGIDNPAWLTSGCAAEMRRKLFRSDYLPVEVLPFFPDLVAAIRLGWLGEWVDLNETELASGELQYIRCLLDHRTDLV